MQYEDPTAGRCGLDIDLFTGSADISEDLGYPWAERDGNTPDERIFEATRFAEEASESKLLTGYQRALHSAER